jgi:uncharacterized protein (TIRG00374 family)
MKRLWLLLWLPVPLLLTWSLRGLDWRLVWRLLSRLNMLQLAVLVALNLLFLLVLGTRWGLILHGLGRPLRMADLPRLIAWRLAGFAVSYLTPGPQFGGEPLQLVLARRRGGIDYTAGSASLLLDKSYELAGNFAFLAVGAAAALSLPGLVPARFSMLLAAVSLLALLPLGYLLATARGFRPLTRLLGLPARLLRRAARHSRLQDLAARAEQAVGGTSRRAGRLAAEILLFFLLVWGLAIAETALVLRFLGLALSRREVILVLAAGKLAFLLPFPGAWGALEASQRLLFAFLNRAPEAAVSLLVYIRARDLLLVLSGLAVIALRPRRSPPLPAAEKPPRQSA